MSYKPLPPTSRLLNFDQVRYELNIDNETLWELIRCDELPVVWVGSARRIDRLDLEAYTMEKEHRMLYKSTLPTPPFLTY